MLRFLLQIQSCNVAFDPLIINSSLMSPCIEISAAKEGPGEWRVQFQQLVGRPWQAHQPRLAGLPSCILLPQPFISSPKLSFLLREHIKLWSFLPPPVYHNLPVLCPVPLGSCPLLSDIYPVNINIKITFKVRSK